MVFRSMEAGFMGDPTMEWPEDGCDACHVVVNDCADCQASVGYCTDQCFVEEEACEECEPCFDESCCYVDETSHATGCDMADPCCAAASTLCTLEDCPGPAALEYMPPDLRSLQYPETDCTFAGHDFHQQCNTMTQPWSQQFNHQDQISQTQLNAFFQEYCPDAKATAYRLPSPTDVGSTLTYTSPVSDASDLSRRNSELVQSSMTIAAGMRMLYTCRADDCEQTFNNYMQLDQHVLNNHVSHKDAATTNTPDEAHSSDSTDSGIDVQDSPVSSTFKVQAVNRHHQCKWLTPNSHGRNVPCNTCFASKRELTDHLKAEHIGSRRKEYICLWDGCDRQCKPFTQRQKIEKHLVVHTHDRPFKCSQCSYVASDDATLRQHARTHTGEKPFECPICHKTFSASTSVSVHMRLHTGDKPLVCTFPGCGKRFSESSNMTKHMRIHALGKEFACDVDGCEKKFQRSDQLKRHKRTVHRQHTSSSSSCCMTAASLATKVI